MNKVFNINLGSIPFTIDEDAYEHLSNYLKTIHNHFRTSEGYEEITTDIEARLAELFQEKLGGRPIVTLKDVNSVIAIMGTPEDFGAEPLSDEAPRSSSSKKWKIKTGKRLFRNPEEEVVGGVCSGIAAYFGIPDPLWVRLLFVLFAITGGFAIPLYVILWAILPKAETASDRLSMRGDPINASNIGKIIEEEIVHVSKRVNELGDELKAEFGSKKKSGPPEGEKTEGAADAGHHFRAAATEGVHVLGSVIRAIVEILGKIIKPVAFVIGIVLVVMLALIWIGTVAGLFWGMPFSSFLFPGSIFLTTLGVVSSLLFLGIPILMITLSVMRIFMRTNFKPRWAIGLWVFWIVNLVALMFVATSAVREFSASGDMSLGATNTSILNADTLHIEVEENSYKDVLLNFGDELYLSGDKLVSKNLSLRIEKSETGKFEILQSNFSRGNSIEEGQRLAAGIDYQYRIEGNKVILPETFTVTKGTKWRAQKVNLTLKVPVGKWVKITEPVNRILHEVQTDENYKFPWWGSDYAWKMGPNGMTAPAYIEEQKKNYSFDNFSKINLEGPVRLVIKQGDAYSVNLTSGKDYEEDISISKENDLLSISTDVDPGEPVIFEITMPSLQELVLSNSGDVSLRDFNLDNLKIVNEGEAKIEAFVNVQNLEVELNGDNELEIKGQGNRLKAMLDNNTRMDAEQFNAKVADITASGDSWVKVSVSDTLRQQLDESSNIISQLKPVVISTNL
jgi:phage shock protein PspC (stress-responsive transcriptional regulator)